jgi:hypothetical protein
MISLNKSELHPQRYQDLRLSAMDLLMAAMPAKQKNRSEAASLYVDSYSEAESCVLTTATRSA